MNGLLYGTTAYGGARDAGTVFEVSTAGAERVVYSFNGTGGAHPLAGLLALNNGKLYGTTYWGGVHNAGTVFEVSTAGAERVVYNFNGTGGKHPEAGLIEMNGLLYGTTAYGGGNGGEKLTPFRR